MRIRMIAVIAMCVLGLAAVAPAQEDAAAKRQELQQKQRELRDKLNQLRMKLSREPDLADAQKAMMEVRKAADEKVMTDPKVQAARKTADEAQKAVREVIDQQVAASAEVATARKALEVAEDHLFELEAQKRLTDFQINEWKRRILRDPELRKLSDKALKDALDRKLASTTEGKELTTKLAELETKIKSAQEASQTAQKGVGDARMKIQRDDPKVAEARRKADPAEAEFRKAKSEAMSPGREAVDKTQKEFDAKVDAKLAANTEAAALKTELDAVNKQIAELSAGPRKPATKQGG